MAETERQLEGGVALGGRAVTDADDLELLDEALAHTDDHVVDERAHEAVHRTVLTLVVRALDEQLRPLLPHGDLTGDVEVEGALGALEGDAATSDRRLDAAGNRDGSASHS